MTPLKAASRPQYPAGDIPIVLASSSAPIKVAITSSELAFDSQKVCRRRA
jgi:hypothetical protein